MDRNFLLKLTKEVYRLTLLFPKKEPLRYKMREMADKILAKAEAEDLTTLASFFEVAKAQNWVKANEILALQEEYDKLKQDVLVVKRETKKDNPFPKVKVFRMVPERQEKILTYLRENGRVQVWQIKQLFPDISKRTLRRDFEKMTTEGVLERIGEKNNTFYQLKREEV